jgi:hypothetical protein
MRTKKPFLDQLIKLYGYSAKVSLSSDKFCAAPETLRKNAKKTLMKSAVKVDKTGIRPQKKFL